MTPNEAIRARLKVLLAEAERKCHDVRWEDSSALKHRARLEVLRIEAMLEELETGSDTKSENVIHHHRRGS
jgi:hypothetical protein